VRIELNSAPKSLSGSGLRLASSGRSINRRPSRAPAASRLTLATLLYPKLLALIVKRSLPLSSFFLSSPQVSPLSVYYSLLAIQLIHTLGAIAFPYVAAI
jgi:hypothetical protein